VDELTKALAEGKLDGLKGIRREEAGFDQARDRAAGEIRWTHGHRRRPAGGRIIGRAVCARLPGVINAEYAGSLRRRRENRRRMWTSSAPVKDETQGQAISDAFVKFPEVVRVLGQGPTKASVLTASGIAGGSADHPRGPLRCRADVLHRKQGAQRPPSRPAPSTWG